MVMVGLLVFVVSSAFTFSCSMLARVKVVRKVIVKILANTLARLFFLAW